ncbi:MAG: hypothetical protein QGH20_11435, partial [Candidatus Latescibacteria bacterium]|nr:hypothetical protein [Candidatus Latescibacterota bacterium]
CRAGYIQRSNYGGLDGTRTLEVGHGPYVGALVDMGLLWFGIAFAVNSDVVWGFEDGLTWSVSPTLHIYWTPLFGGGGPVTRD